MSDRRIEVVNHETGEVLSTHTPDSDWAWEMLAQEWLSDDPNVVRIPVWAIAWRRALKDRPQSCVYTATDAFCKKFLGRELDYHDKDFFELHPLTVKDGVGAAETPRVVQDLIEPYRLRVSRIYWTEGVAPPGDLVHWMDSLGVNPLAMMDYRTTNAEFAKQVGMPPSEADRQFRFEFRSDNLRPCISCGTVAGFAVQKGMAHTVKFEHAQYRSPRDPYGKALMQLQIAPASEVPWHTPLPDLGLPAKQAGWELNISECKTKENKLLPWIEKNKKEPYEDMWHDWLGTSSNMGKKGKQSSGYTDGQGMLPLLKSVPLHNNQLQELDRSQEESWQYDSLGPKNICLLHDPEAKNGPQHIGDMLTSGLCDMCWTKIWSMYKCFKNNCAANLGDSIYVGITKQKKDRWYLTCACSSCGTVNQLSTQHDTQAARAVGIILGKYKGGTGGGKIGGDSGSKGQQAPRQGGAASVLPRTHKRTGEWLS